MNLVNKLRRVGMQVDFVSVGGIEFYPTYMKRQWFVSRCGKVIGAKGVILKPLDNGKGYKQVSFQDVHGKIVKVHIHRLVAETFIGTVSGKYVNHKDGIKSNNHVENLELVTAKENTAHAIRIGLCKNLPQKGQQGFQNGTTAKDI